MKRAVFLDRDNTLMRNVPYLGDPSQVTLLPTVAETLQAWVNEGRLLFVVSNQSGVGRGLITPAQVESVNQELSRQLGGQVINRFYSCFEEPREPNGYQRKASPQLVFEAAREYGLDLTRSWFIGDRLADVLSGRNAGCRTALVLTGTEVHELPTARRFATVTGETLASVRAQIGQHETLR